MSLVITSADRERIRRQFPALSGETIFLENAGGSQVPLRVADAMRNTMLQSYVQLGAGYPLSRLCTEMVDRAHAFAELLMNATDGRVILGPSSSALLRMLADCYAQVLRPGQEIILAENGHEANLGPWKRLAERGLIIKWWRVDPRRQDCPLEHLQQLLSPSTALVALPHVSNLLGGIADLPRITAMAHEAGARVVADGVAYAPHRAMDVAAWDVDWYACSAYKVYGPHLAALYGHGDALGELTGPNHFFIPTGEIPHKFELGGVSHEACAGLLGLAGYLKMLAGEPDSPAIDRRIITAAWAVMEACERPLLETLLSYLRGKSAVTIIGPSAVGAARVGTVSFVHGHKTSREITAVVDRSHIAIRHGHMYAYHLCEALGLDPDDGVVRISLVHYNTPQEIDRLLEVLDTVL
jgi:cysteine desulfurase family protein (TIGR01976 family)